VSLPLACGDRSGFLFAHACDRPAAGACVTCGRPICLEHTRAGAAGPACISCLRGEPRDESTSTHERRSSSDSSGGSSASAPDAADDPAATREGHFGGAGASALWQQREGERADPARADDPYFYGGGADRTAYYDADDYRAFDALTTAAAAESAGDPGEADAAPDTDTGAS
jgi:hypothetical protein